VESEGQGKRPPVPVPVEITRSDVLLCFDFAIRCARLRRYAASEGWRGGLVPSMSLFGGVAVDSTVAGIVIGKVAEVAMCRLSSVPIDLALRETGDGGCDLLLPCGTTQVKASRRPFATKFVREPFEHVDWFVLATWSGQTSSVSVEGYVSRAAMGRMEIASSPCGRWMNRQIPTHELLPIRSLLRIRPIHEVL
jgi:hypothetical protein